VHTSTTLTLSAAKVAFGHEQAERLSVQVTAATGASPTGQVAINAGATPDLHRHPRQRQGIMHPDRQQASRRHPPAHWHLQR
jgi:hypothetical protein